MPIRLLHRLVTLGRTAARGLRRRLLAATRPAVAPPVVGTLADLARSKPAPVAEDAFLRHQLAVLHRGARGRAPADLDALVETLARFSQLCLDLRADVAEIDINPLLVYEAGRGVRVVDCLIVPKSES